MAAAASEATSWLLAVIVPAAAAVAAAAGKVWLEQRAEIRQLRAELERVNQREHAEHVRTLRRMSGLSTSAPPPPRKR
jgi:hypothetical protein